VARQDGWIAQRAAAPVNRDLSSPADCTSAMADSSRSTTSGRQRFHWKGSTRATKDPFAALIQSFAAAVLHHLLQQALNGLNAVHQIFEFRELPSR
jgi:hypothetical protein